jgi:hypothetical protein
MDTFCFLQRRKVRKVIIFNFLRSLRLCVKYFRNYLIYSNIKKLSEVLKVNSCTFLIDEKVHNKMCDVIFPVQSNRKQSLSDGSF